MCENKLILLPTAGLFTLQLTAEDSRSCHLPNESCTSAKVQLVEIESGRFFLFALKRSLFLFSLPCFRISTSEESFNSEMADLGDFFEHCNELYHLSSKVPKEARQEDCILGIDEAGRGPVLGKLGF